LAELNNSYKEMLMYRNRPVSLSSQRGLSITGLIVGLAVLAAFAMLGMKVLPPVLEYKSAKEALVVAKEATGRPQTAFQKAIDINDIKSLTSKDLIVYKANGVTELAFDYEVRVDLFKDVALLLHFAATTDPSGVIPEPAVEPAK
jgi:hypothetical protein